VAGHRGGLLTDVAGRRRVPAGPGGGGPGVDTPSVQTLPGPDGTRLAYADRRAVAELRPGEPWFPGAGHSPWQDDPAAFVRVVVGSSAADGRADTGRR
jgi:hypothetical protein